MDCPFCSIDSLKTRIISSKKNVLVLLSNPRLMKGHILVVPKRHVEKVSELNSEEKAGLFETIEEFQEKILQKIAKGCDIRQNYRPFQAQTNLKVNHLHFHLQPRELFDELYEKCQVYEKELFQELDKSEEEEVLEKLSKDE